MSKHCPSGKEQIEFFDQLDIFGFNFVCISEEVAKLQQRLALLREEYVKLQKHCEAIEKDRAMLRALSSSQNVNGENETDENSFIGNILKAVASMLKSDEYR